jgi:hypothetical protein
MAMNELEMFLAAWERESAPGLYGPNREETAAMRAGASA